MALSEFREEQRFSRLMDQCVAARQAQLELRLAESASEIDLRAGGRTSDEAVHQFHGGYESLAKATYSLDLIAPQSLRERGRALLAAVTDQGVVVVRTASLDEFEAAKTRSRQEADAFNAACANSVGR